MSLILKIYLYIKNLLVILTTVPCSRPYLSRTWRFSILFEDKHMSLWWTATFSSRPTIDAKIAHNGCKYHFLEDKKSLLKQELAPVNPNCCISFDFTCYLEPKFSSYDHPLDHFPFIKFILVHFRWLKAYRWGQVDCLKKDIWSRLS